jgi:Protein of unknown function (DUF1571)
MAHRTDAGRTRPLIQFSVLLAASGCATLTPRQPPPATAPPPATTAKTKPPRPMPALANAEALAITAPPRSDQPPSAVRPAAHEPAPEAPAAPAAVDPDTPRRLYRDAAAAYAKQPSYIARLKRREWANGRPRPEETLLFKFRERPWSVHFKWLGEEGQGREVLYVRGQHGDKLHILTAANDVPFTPAGRHMALAPDSFLVRSASRYPITEAGVGRIIERFGRLIEAVDKGQPGAAVKFLGPAQRPEYPTPLDGVECHVPADFAPEVPQGGRRLVYFDPANRFPVMSVTYDLAGQEVDYACFDRFQLDVRLDDDDFDPDKLWGRKP